MQYALHALLAGLLLGAAACSPADQQGSFSGMLQPNDLMKPKILGTDMRILGSMPNPPLTASDGALAYRISGCLIKVYPENATIIAIGVKSEPSCHFDPSPFLGETYHSLSDVTFGKLGGGVFYLKCPQPCVNGSDPYVVDNLSQTQVRNGIGVMLVAHASDPATSSALDQWLDVVSRGEGNIFYDRDVINCSSKYNQTAQDLFSPISPTEVYFVRVGAIVSTYQLPPGCDL